MNPMLIFLWIVWNRCKFLIVPERRIWLKHCLKNHLWANSLDAKTKHSFDLRFSHWSPFAMWIQLFTNINTLHTLSPGCRRRTPWKPSQDQDQLVCIDCSSHKPPWKRLKWKGDKWKVKVKKEVKVKSTLAKTTNSPRWTGCCSFQKRLKQPSE